MRLDSKQILRIESRQLRTVLSDSLRRVPLSVSIGEGSAQMG